MLACYRAGGMACADGYFARQNDKLLFHGSLPFAAPVITEERQSATGQLFSLSGCQQSERALCWENTLVMGQATASTPGRR